MISVIYQWYCSVCQKVIAHTEQSIQGVTHGKAVRGLAFDRSDK